MVFYLSSTHYIIHVGLFIPGGGLALKLNIKGRAFFEKRKK
jgi:hypothetical protein